MTQILTPQERALTQTHAQTSKLGLCVYRPGVVFEAQVTGTGDGSSGLILTGITGLVADMGLYFTVVVGSAPAQSDLGKVRFRIDNGGGVITVSANNIAWSTDPFITGLSWIEPLSIIPDLGNDQMDSDVSYDGLSNIAYHPLSRIGPPAFGLTGEAINFYALPQAITPGASIVSHAWEFPGSDTPTSPLQGSAAAPIPVTWAAQTGHFASYVKYTATDSNGRTHSRYNPVFVFDTFDLSSGLHCDLEIQSLQNDWDSGFASMSITVRDGGDFANYPEDAFVTLVAEDWYGATKQSIGGNWVHRENILFSGYIVSDTVQINAETGAVSFEVLGIMGMAEKLTSWPANLEDNGNPSRWDRLRGMTTGLAAFHMLTERTTIDHIADFNYNDGRTLEALDIPETSVKQQLDDYCVSAARQRIVSDFQGNMYIVPNINLLLEADRTLIPQTAELDTFDARDQPGINLAREDQVKALAQLDFVGFGWDGQDAEPFYSLAPGKQFEHGRITKTDGIRVDNQTESNAVSGLYLAEANNIFTEIRWPLFNLRIWDIAPVQYATVSFDGTDNPRGIVWVNQKIIPRSIGYIYNSEDQHLDVDPVFEKDSFGPPGITGFYPSAPPPSPNPPAPATSIMTKAILTYDHINGTYFKNLWGSVNGSLTGGDIIDSSGDIDPFWPIKVGSHFALEAIGYKTVLGKVFKSDHKVNDIRFWEDVTPSFAYQPVMPNLWGLLSAPGIATFDLDDFRSSYGTEDLMSFVGNFEIATDSFISMMATTKVAARQGNNTWNWAGVRGWWLPDELENTLGGVAYRPIGSVDLPTSYFNDENPGTDDATLGLAPAFDRLVGWTFTAASSQFLIAPPVIPLDGRISIFVKMAATVGSAATAFGSTETGALLNGTFQSGSFIRLNAGALTTLVPISTTPQTIVAICRRTDGVTEDTAMYKDGTELVSGAAQTYTASPQPYIGAANTGAGAGNFSNCAIGAFAMFFGALTEIEIQAIMAQMEAIKVP